MKTNKSINCQGLGSQVEKILFNWENIERDINCELWILFFHHEEKIWDCHKIQVDSVDFYN